MAVYLLRRIIMTIPILIGVSMLSFGIMYFAPGKPAFINTLALDPNVSQEALQKQLDALGLNDPVPVQYARWLKNFVQGDMGTSFIRKRPVNTMISERLGNTMLLTSISLLFALIIAVPIGIYSAYKPYSVADIAATNVSFLGLATPDFWLGLMLIMVFSVHFGLSPVGGVATLGAAFTGAEAFWDRARHLILPVIVFGTASTAVFTRYMRSSMMEVLSQDYVRTARAKGLREPKVVLKHGVRNALIPVITIIGLSIPTLVGGSVIIETVFSWPGLGKLFIDATFQRDYPVIMALVMITSVLTILGNLLADIMYAFVDPRIKY